MTETTTTVEQPTENPSMIDQFKAGWTNFVPLILIFIFFYFFLIRPQEKKRRSHQMMVNSLKKGENVMTNSGMFGKVIKINDSDSVVHVEIAENVVIKILKTAIADLPDRKKDSPAKKA